MFKNCSSLTGQNGSTIATLNSTDATYAKIDKPGDPGYLSELPQA